MSVQDFLKSRGVAGAGTTAAAAPTATSTPSVAAFLAKKGLTKAAMPTKPAAPSGIKVLEERTPKPTETGKGPFTPRPVKAVEDAAGVRTITMPGGGQFKMDATGKPIITDRAVTAEQKKDVRGGDFATTGIEVDHKISKALGGTDEPTNLQALKDKKTISQAAYDFLTGRKSEIGDYQPQNRQEGKMIVEQEAINRYRKGLVTLDQARSAVMNHDNPDLVEQMLGVRIGGKPKPEAPAVVERGVHSIYGKTLGLAGVDQNLADELLKHGEGAKALELASESADADFLPQLGPAVARTAADTGLTIARALPRAVVKVGISAAEFIRSKLGIGNEVKSITPDKSDLAGRALLGDEPIKTLQQSVPEGMKIGRDVGTAVGPKIGLTPQQGSNIGGPLGGGAVLAGTVLDLIPGIGGEKKLVQESLEAGIRKVAERELGRALTEIEEKNLKSAAVDIGRRFKSVPKAAEDVARLEEEVAGAGLAIRHDVPFVEKSAVQEYLTTQRVAAKSAAQVETAIGRKLTEEEAAAIQSESKAFGPVKAAAAEAVPASDAALKLTQATEKARKGIADAAESKALDGVRKTFSKEVEAAVQKVAPAEASAALKSIEALKAAYVGRRGSSFIHGVLDDAALRLKAMPSILDDQATTSAAKEIADRFIPKFAESTPTKATDFYVQRIEEAGVRPDLEKPQGLYTTPADVQSPHEDLGGAKSLYKVSGDAKIAEVDTSGIAMKRGIDSNSAGIVYLRQSLSPEEIVSIRSMSKDDLIAYAKEKYPSVDWTRYTDDQEILEGVAGMKGRENGIDVIRGKDAQDPRFDEVVVLNPKVLEKGAAAGAPDRMESIGEYLKGRPAIGESVDPANVVPTTVAPIDPAVASIRPRMSVFEEVTGLRNDAEEIRKAVRNMRELQPGLADRLDKLERAAKKAEQDFFQTLPGVTGEESIADLRKRAEEEIQRKFAYESAGMDMYPDTEMEFGFQNFRAAAKRRPWLLDEATDVEGLKKKIGDKLGNLDNLFFENGAGMKDNDILDAFKERIKREAKLKKPDLQFLRSYDAAERRLAESQATMDAAMEALQGTAGDKQALEAAIGALEGRLSAVEDTRKVISGLMTGYKDITPFMTQARDLWRNTRRVFGKDAEAVAKVVLNPLEDAKDGWGKATKAALDDLYENIVKKLGILKDSKESAAVQKFGEGEMTQLELVKEFGEKRADDLVSADRYFRAKYEDMIERVNAVMRRVYPGNPDKLLKHRKDYYRHFQEMESGFRQLLQVFETPSAIDPRLAGVSDFTVPKEKFLPIRISREGNQTKYDAVGGFMNYLNHAIYAEHITPAVANIRAFRRDLAEATVDTKNLNHYLESLEDVANDLAGKTNPWDRALQKLTGRTAFRAVDWFNRRFRTNQILGNVSSSLAQAGNLPQGIASAGIHSAPAMLDTLRGIVAEEAGPIAQSAFIRERYIQSAFTRFDTKMLDKARNVAGWMTSVLDEGATKFMWNAQYRKAVAAGAEDPIRVADRATRALVGGRGIGEAPILQKSKAFQVLAPFTLEVGNLWHVMHDMVSAKQFGQLAGLLVLNNVMNRAMVQVRGTPVTLDPIQAVIDSIQSLRDEQTNYEKAKHVAGRLSGELLSNIPLGSTIVSSLSDQERQQIFGLSKDPARYGTGLAVTKGIRDLLQSHDPSTLLAQYALPFGGNQVKKVIEGTKAYREGEIRDRGGNQQYDVDQNLENLIRAVLFGRYGISNVIDSRGYTDQLNEAIVAQDGGSQATSKAAMKAYNEIKALPSDAQQQRLLQLKNEDPETYKVFERIHKERALGITISDRKLRSLGVTNGARATFIYNQLKKLPTADVNQYVGILQEKKIITDEVFQQLLKLKAGEKI